MSGETVAGGGTKNDGIPSRAGNSSFYLIHVTIPQLPLKVINETLVIRSVAAESSDTFIRGTKKKNKKKNPRNVVVIYGM